MVFLGFVDHTTSLVPVLTNLVLCMTIEMKLCGRGCLDATTYFKILNKLLYSSVHNRTVFFESSGAELLISSPLNPVTGDVINTHVAPKTPCVSSSSVSTTRAIF